MRGPRIVIIGAGSFFFGRPVIWNMVNSPVLREGTLVLVDRDPEVLKTMGRLARRVFDHAGVATGLECHEEAAEAVAGADFVVMSFSDRNTHFRGLDTEIAAKYNVHMCSADTIGPGGIFRALREIPHALSIARAIEAEAPEAWVINFVNPATVLGIAMERHTNLRSFAICDGPHEPHITLRTLKRAGLLEAEAEAVPPEMHAKLDLRITGVNHFSWITRFVYGGQDMMPRFIAKVKEASEQELAQADPDQDGFDVHRNADSKAAFNNTYALELYEVFGAFPDCIAHTKEYVPYYQPGIGTGRVEPEPLRCFDAASRQSKMAEHMAQNRKWAEGEAPIETFMEGGRSDHATDIIESMWGGLGKVFRLNTPNRGAVPNMPDDAYLELASHVDLERVQPLPAGPLPTGVRGLAQGILDAHELTADAAAACDRDLLLRAFACDPIVNNLADARAMIAELLEAERDALPAGWFSA